MDKKDFFVKDELKDIKVEGQIFKYKPVDSGDELDWANDYLEDKIEIIKGKDGLKDKEVIKKVPNLAKLSICKLRNIMEVPFTKEELKDFCGIDKEFKDYTNSDKDLCFRKLNSVIYNQLINTVDKINHHKKKS